MELKEAQLFRFLYELFGKESIVHGMSVWAICEGQIKEPHTAWAQGTKCLFSVIDQNDQAKMVVEFFTSKSAVVELEILEKNQLLPKLFSDVGIKYITFTEDELDELIQKESSNSFQALLQAKLVELEEFS